ncbi:unnamed protein product [Adineta steineri]|uniref:Endonuclease V n=1 Tax=Adineta steineri TaxID=433720 RepID=A0A818ZJF1_9BILA|nr:unnamed protein product [Adineta steineri]
MTNSYSITIPKTDLQLKKVSDFTTGIFIDNSGSTSSQLVSIGKNVLQAELSVCQATEFNHIILWNTSAKLCTNINSVRPEGGTNPTTIFQNELTKKAFDQSDVIVFVTDGEIDNSSVTQFATQTKDNLNKALVICIIVHKQLSSPSKINISVVAPLMMTSNVLCLYYDGEIFYILSSKGYISNFYNPSEDLNDYKNLNTLNINELFHNIQIYEYRKIPDGCIPIRDNENEIIAIDFNQLLNTKDLNKILELSENDWKILIQYGKIGNKLNELRTFVSQMKNQAIESDKEICKLNFNLNYSKQRDEIISKIVTLKLNENEYTNELNRLRQQLHEISDQAKIEEIQYLKYINENLHKTRQYWNNIQNLIHEQEIGSYSINDFTFASNRANRAKILTTTDEEYSNITNILDHTNVPLFECAICMEQGPFVLWLKQPTNIDDTTNDFIINFPLEGNDSLRHCIVSNPVCGLCAKSYMNATMNNSNQLITLYRESCTGFIPLNWSTESNRKYINYTLFQILTENKILPHVQMLFLSMIDDYKSNWFDQQIKDYLLKEIIENIYTTDSFSDEGKRMIFRDALKEIVKQEDKFFRQPFKAVCRILNFNYNFHQLDKNIIKIILRKRFGLMCIENQCSITKFGPEHLIIVKQQLYDILFDTLCGIPLYGSLKKININDEKLKEFLKKSYSTFSNSIDKLTTNIGIDKSTIFPNEIVSFFLYLLTTVTVHDRPMKLYIDFSLKHRPLRDNMQIEWSEFDGNVNKNIFGSYHLVSAVSIPSYAINLGSFSCPSKLFFNTEPLWDNNLENKNINIVTLMNQLKTNLDNKLRNLYGSCVPNNSSAHILLHRIVAETLETKHGNEEIMNEEMIMNCMIRIGQTGGRKGNIYAEYVFSQVVLAIENYLKFRQITQNKFKVNDENLSRSYQYKILTELLASGMEYNEITDEVLFEPSKLKVPQMLTAENSNINFNELKKRVQELYIASRNIPNNNNQTCLNIEIKDFIEFAYKMNPDDLLPVWTQEQQNIVHSIITDVDQIEQPLKYVAGLDISFVKTNDKAVASMVIFDYETLNIVAKISVNCNMKIPYIANYLAFREAPVFMKLIDIQKEHCPHLTPQVILMDGNGVWHPRRAGIAAHFGVLSNIPCFGVSKNVLYADGITREKIEDLLTEKAPKEDQYIEVIGDSGNILGLAYNVTGFVKNAVYISVGHKITLSTACNIFKSVTKYRNCEPIRQADLLSREMVAKLT